jgi:hypothetical protein
VVLFWAGDPGRFPVSYARALSPLHSVDVVMSGDRLREVYLDGKSILGVRRLQSFHKAGNPSVLILELVIDDLVVRSVGGSTVHAMSSDSDGLVIVMETPAAKKHPSPDPLDPGLETDEFLP